MVIPEKVSAEEFAMSEAKLADPTILLFDLFLYKKGPNVFN